MADGAWLFASAPLGPLGNDPLIDEPEGLAINEKGAFRISYRADENLWLVYFENGSEYIDPLSIDTVFGEVTSSLFTSEELPFIVVRGQNTGTVFFDDFNVEVTSVPVPASFLLFTSSLIGLWHTRKPLRRREQRGILGFGYKEARSKYTLG